MPAGSPAVPLPRIPVALTSLVGREREVAALQVLLFDPSVRLLTLAGPGGVGKTRLASEVARNLASQFTHGAAFVSLAHVRDADLVPATIAVALGVREVPGQSIQVALVSELANRDMLLVLDNFEQVDHAAPFLNDLLAAEGSLRILVTSRSLLQLRGEHHFPVSPLAIPDGQALPPLAELAGLPAIRLFSERARAATGEFSLTAASAPAVASICRRLDGLPLAIELAASMTRLLPPEALAIRLAERVIDLGGGPRDLPVRQQTLRDTIAWSYDLLEEQDRVMFNRLSAFVGGWNLEAAQAIVCCHDNELLESLRRLIDRNLIYRSGSTAAEIRFSMLETIKAFAHEKLDQSCESETIHRQHTIYFMDLAKRARRQLKGPDHGVWLARLATEYGNLSTVLDRALLSRDAETALGLGAELWRFWAEQGHLSEGRTTLERALEIESEVAPLVRADAIYKLGNLALDLCDFSVALQRFSEFVSIAEEIGDEDGVASGHHGLGLVHCDLGEFDTAREHFASALTIWSRINDVAGIALSHETLGKVAIAQGNHDIARKYHEHALRMKQDLGDVSGVAYSQWYLAHVARLLGRVDEAKTLFTGSLCTFRSLGDLQGESLVLQGLGLVAQQAGEDLEAVRLLESALTRHRSLGDRDGQVKCIEGIATVVAHRGYLEKAVLLLGATIPLRGVSVAVPIFGEREAQERTLALARRTLTTSAFEAAWAAGTVLSLEQASQEALQLTGDLPVVAHAPVPFNLTRREREVLDLLCQHLTDGEIASRLYLSPRTASNHVASILSKLGLANRREVVSFAIHHGLVQAS